MNNESKKGNGRIKLRLYVIGNSPHTQTAKRNLERLLEGGLSGAEAEVVNILDEPELAYRDKITTAPVLIRLHPLPRVMFLGDLSDIDAIMDELNSTTDQPDD